MKLDIQCKKIKLKKNSILKNNLNKLKSTRASISSPRKGNVRKNHENQLSINLMTSDEIEKKKIIKKYDYFWHKYKMIGPFACYLRENGHEN